MEAKEFLSTKQYLPAEPGNYLVWLRITGYDVFWWDGKRFISGLGYTFEPEEIDKFYPVKLPDLTE